MKVLFVGTHINQQNGYSKILYQLIKHLSSINNITISLYGVQNRKDTQIERKLPSNVYVFDALSAEKTSEDGFNFSFFPTFVEINQPDILFIYNDPYIVCSYLKSIEDISKRPVICAYLDIVYPFIKPDYIDLINRHVDHVFTFSDTWNRICSIEGITCSLSVIEHGITEMEPSTKLNIDLEDHFVILNLNRNQTRKRIDITVKAFCNLLKHYENLKITIPLKLILRSLNGAFPVMDIFNRHMKLLNCEKNIHDHIIFLNNDDRDNGVDDVTIHQLYKHSDIGISSSEGEGFGLCNFEHASYSKPQIVPRIGSFPDMFKDAAIYIEPYASYYIDSYRDCIGGQAFLINDIDLTNAMIKYIEDPKLRHEHGELIKNVVSNERFQWKNITNNLHNKFNELLSM